MTFLNPHMIAYLRGTVIQKTAKTFILNVHDVGYEICAPQRFLSAIAVGEEREAHIFLHTKENLLDLYGFPTQEEKRIFVLLLGVSGIGPKSALHLFDLVEAQGIVQAILSQQPEILISKGVGRKTAEKIVRELASKLDTETVREMPNVFSDQQDIVEVLKVLGYQGGAIQQILPQLSMKSSLEDKVKQALQLLHVSR